MTHRTARPHALLRALPAAVLLALAVPAQAQSLQSLFDAAKTYDATFQAAKAQFDASTAKAAQAQAGILPSVGLSAGAFWTKRDSSPGTASSIDSQNLNLDISHPLYRPGNRLAVEQAEQSLLVAQAQLQAAEQDLIVRTSQAYFDVLAAQDNLTFVQAQKKAVEQQLAAAQRNFEVGSATITDTREAQARFDLTTAQEIASQNDLRVKKLALDQLVGQAGTAPWRLPAPVALPAVQPADMATWVARAEADHPSLRQASAGLQIAQLETRKAQSALGPTLDAKAQYQVARGIGSTAPFSNSWQNVGTIGVQFNLPLYSGHGLQNRVQETVALEDKARNDLEAARRGVVQATRTAFFGLESGMGQVKALEAAEASSQSALDANQLGYQVGVRINIDVLNAQSQLFQTKASLAKARYDVLVGHLRLKQASGVLQASDLAPINALLKP